MNASGEPHPGRRPGAPLGTVHPLANQPWWRKAHSLKIEIALAFGVVIALMLALGIAFYLSEQRSAIALDKLLKTDSRMADLSLRSAQAMLRAHAAESDFLLAVNQLGVVEARERYVLPMQNHLLDMREYLTSFRILSTDPSLLDKIGQIEQQAQLYENGFLDLVDSYGKPGQGKATDRSRQPYVTAVLAIEPLLEDLHTAATKRAILTRNSVDSAAKITRWTIVIALAIATLLGIIVAVVVWRRITGSVTQLVSFSRQVAAGDFSARAPQGSEHEFEILAHAMNQMAESLDNSQRQLLATARLAGMAEIATNVLHNVGNVLNSVNVSAGLIGTRLHTSRVKGLTRAVSLMDEHADDLGEFLTHDARGKLLPTYLRELAQALEAEHISMAEELLALGKSVDHIKEVVATQQSYAGTPRLIEFVNFDELVDDALRMNAGVLPGHEVTVVKEFADLPALPLDRHRLLQILVNLIANARQAMDGVADQVYRLTLRVGIVELMDPASGVHGRRLRIAVADNGEGIAADNLTRIFTHGFTTRQNGHGFGLHSCALAAIEMGGSLSAHSDGPGHGATFTLDLPLKTEGVTA